MIQKIKTFIWNFLVAVGEYRAERIKNNQAFWY